jgi:hypothetical protein
MPPLDVRGGSPLIIGRLQEESTAELAKLNMATYSAPQVVRTSAAPGVAGAA